jgi:hypothetical protein
VFLLRPQPGKSIRAEGIHVLCVVPCRYVMKFLQESTVLPDVGG